MFRVMVAVIGCLAGGVVLVSARQEPKFRSGSDTVSIYATVLDQTGAGDAYVGTLSARLVLGDDLVFAARQAAAASSLVVGSRGGTGYVPTLDQIRQHLAAAGTVR